MRVSVGATMFVVCLLLWAATATAQVTVGPFNLPAGAEVTIEVDVLVADPVADPANDWSLCTQGTVTGTGFAAVLTDDPDGGGGADTTCSSLADFGDAPTGPSYPQDAVHAIASGLRLGTALDADGGAQGTASADGDDLDGNDDDDGVVFGTINQNQMVSVGVTASAPCILNAWIDWDADGNWSGTNDQIFIDQALVAGTNNLSFMAPASIFIGTTFTRFRCSTTPGLGPGGTGGATPDGEVEDYEVVTTVPVELQSFVVE